MDTSFDPIVRAKRQPGSQRPGLLALLLASCVSLTIASCETGMSNVAAVVASPSPNAPDVVAFSVPYVPPHDAVRYIIENAREVSIDLQPTQSLEGVALARCGYVSKPYMEALQRATSVTDVRAKLGDRARPGVKVAQCLKYEGREYVVKSGDSANSLAREMGLISDSKKTPYPAYVVDAIVGSVLEVNPRLAGDAMNPLRLNPGDRIRLPISPGQSTTTTLWIKEDQKKHLFEADLKVRLNPQPNQSMLTESKPRTEDAAAWFYAFVFRENAAAVAEDAAIAQFVPPVPMACPGPTAYDPKIDGPAKFALSKEALASVVSYLKLPYVGTQLGPPTSGRSHLVTVGVLDTGVQVTPFLANLLDPWPDEQGGSDLNLNNVPNEKGGGNVARDIDYKPVTNCYANATAQQPEACSNHGTHVTSLAIGGPAADLAFHQQLRKAFGTSVFPVRFGHFRLVRESTGLADTLGTYEGVEWFHRNADKYPSSAKIMNISFLDQCKVGNVDALKALLRRNGGLVVAAAGNDSRKLEKSKLKIDQSQQLCPALVGGEGAPVITVGALASDGTLAKFSNHGQDVVDILAPGECVPGIVPSMASEGGQRRYSGTSQSAPQVSFAAALVYAMLPSGDNRGAKVKQRLIATAFYNPDLATSARASGSLDLVRAVRIFDDQILLKDGEELVGKFNPNGDDYGNSFCDGPEKVQLSTYDKVAVTGRTSNNFVAQVLIGGSDESVQRFQSCTIPQGYKVEFQVRRPDGSYDDARPVLLESIREIVPRMPN